jgi:DNA-binding transcriptional regulator YbjK
MVSMQNDFDDIVETSQVLINGIVNNFPDAMVQGRTIVRVAKVHSRSFTYGFKSLENLNAPGVIIFTHIIASKSQ